MAYAQRASVAAGAGTTVVRASAGALGSIVVVAAGTGSGAVNVYDNATTGSGFLLAAIPATVAVGTIYPINGVATAGITVVNVALGPQLTVYYD